MDDLTTLVSLCINTGFAVCVATYLLIRTTNVMQEVIVALCDLKKSIALLAEKVENLKR